VRELLASHRDLPAAHAERIARLEDELAEAQRQARTDYVTGLLNERAHAADSEGRDLGHGVMIVPAVELVYDRCGQSSGNRIANDAARILRAAARDRVHLYRMGSAKFALIGPDVDVIKSVLEDIRAALAAATLSVARGDEVPPAGARNLEEHLDLHPKPFGLEVRMRLAGPGGTRVPDPSVRSLMAP
jgi:GGDEF domain-containing protein